jgi:hypothetical protein
MVFTALVTLIPAAEAKGDADVEGLWLTVTTWPEKYDDEELTIEESGEVSCWRNLNSLLFLTVNRWKSAGETDPEAIKKIVAERLDVRASSIKISQDEELSAKYTCPAYRLKFTTGSNEDSNERHGLFIGTDTWDFYLDVTADADYAGGYRDEEFDPKWIDDWFSNLKMVEN